MVPNNFNITIANATYGTTTFNSPFPLRLENQSGSGVVPFINGNVPGIDISRFSFLNPNNITYSLNSSSFMNKVERSEMLHLPCVLDEETFDSDQFTINLPQISPIDAQFNIYIKTNSESGVVTALKVQDFIAFGTGFENDPDWKRIMTINTQEFSGTYGNYQVAILYLSNLLSSYSYLVEFCSSSSTGYSLRITDLDYAEDYKIPACIHFLDNSNTSRVYSQVDETQYLYLSQLRENYMNASAFNNARFIIR